MVWKYNVKYLVVLCCCLACAGSLMADDTKNAVSIASSPYVDYLVRQLDASKQNLFPASGENSGDLGKTVVTYTKRGAGAIGERPIYYGAGYTVDCSGQECKSSKVDTNAIVAVQGLVTVSSAWAQAVGTSVYNNAQETDKKLQEQIDSNKQRADEYQKKQNEINSDFAKRIDENKQIVNEYQKKQDEINASVAKRDDKQDDVLKKQETELKNRQPIIPMAGENAKINGVGTSVVTYTGNAGVLGERGICTGGSCEKTDLISVGAIDSLVIKALVGKTIKLSGTSYKIELIEEKASEEESK